MFYDDVTEGTELEPLTVELTAHRMMAYGAATWDFIRVHYDAAYAKEQGFDAPFVDGQMYGPLLARQVLDWAGPDAFLTKLSFRNRAMAFAGESVTCRGAVESKDTDGDDALVHFDLWVENAQGVRVVDRAKAVVRLPRR